MFKKSALQKMIETNQTLQISCIACAKGFYGADCDIKCPYPWFGQACQSVCVCSVGYCDHVNGCTQSLGSMIFHHVFSEYVISLFAVNQNIL